MSGFSRFDDNGPHGVTPLDWQGNGLDWEVYRNEKPMRAEAYYEDLLMAVVKARTRIGLLVRMVLAQRRINRGGGR